MVKKEILHILEQIESNTVDMQTALVKGDLLKVQCELIEIRSNLSKAENIVRLEVER